MGARGPKPQDHPYLRRLADQGFSATEIARVLGISRQRVYKIAQREKIVFALISRMKPHQKADT